MAANSLLYLLLSTAVTFPPEQSVITESGINAGYIREDAIYDNGPSRWPSFGEPDDMSLRRRQESGYHTESPDDMSVHWRQESGYNTESSDDMSVRWRKESGYNTESPDHGSVRWRQESGYNTESPDDISVSWRDESKYITERPNYRFSAMPDTDAQDSDANWRPRFRTEWPFDRAEDKTYQPYHWESTTEEPECATDEPEIKAMITEEPESETDCPEINALETEEPEYQPKRTQAPTKKKRYLSCPQNEHYKRCGTPCTPTCFENYPCPSNCCVEGCFCNKGLVRNLVGKCVRPEDCPLDSKDEKDKRRCPSREHFSKCHKNCERTCDTYKVRKPCPTRCVSGCVCDGGLVRNKDGKCVPRDQCQKKSWADHDDVTHGCPDPYVCDVYCIMQNKRSGNCEEDICKCHTF